ncbi:MAG: Pycsar system effector family protein [Sphingosinicella sp.]|uniref:Pycsar system effector family protein n=1 Tax=Sphingosinicella sp. TaxID=1917971 RepID=UPI0040379227
MNTEQKQNAPATSPPGIPPEAATTGATLDASAGCDPLAAPMQLDMPGKIEFAKAHSEYINGYIVLADTKAAWVFAIPAAAIAYLASQQGVWTLVTSPGNWLEKLLIAAAFALLLVCASAAFAVIVPRLGKSTEGVVFFAAVANMASADEFLAALAPLDESSLLDARLRHNFEIASVCARKYRMLRRAMWCGLAGLAAMLVSVAFLRIGPF